ncbi:insulinase family protein [Soehngenia longivitae]|uniref:Insulinase family protein n=1 Tax=Soehngenia longivitae TaxID=2562294 RepID=A0A4Z0D3Y8_9FIRM|nr:insulinase family protein [Soehngenia longivitae]TFZ40085.1 insulinase family protein [Soehngenia longivitae]
MINLLEIPISEKIGNGINITSIYTNKFKSNYLSFYFIRPLGREEVTLNALLPMVLNRGSQTYNDFLAIERELELLYGANFDYDVYKSGEKQIIKFSIEWADSKYINDNSVDKKVMEIFFDIIFHPAYDNGIFIKDYVEQEKQNLKNKIKSRINDKRSYAISRCIEEMCKTESFGIYSLGYVEDLDSIDSENLTKHYKKMISETPIEVIYVGDEKEIDITKYIPHNIMNRQFIINIPRETVLEKSQHRNHIEERMQVNQGKLVLGLLSGIPYENELFEALTVGNVILGGSSSSKLFREVREKNSLAYYVNSILFKHKSIILIDSGVDFKNMQRALELINEQIRKIKEADFTDNELQLAKKEITTSLKEIVDSNHSIASYILDNILTKKSENIEDRINKINAVSKEEVVKAFNGVNLDTIYVLTREGEGDIDVKD